MPNFLDQLYEVLLRRTPLNTRPRRFARLHDLPTMSNSIDQPYVNNVELHRLSKLTRPVFSLEIAVELRHGELSSCAIHTEHL